MNAPRRFGFPLLALCLAATLAACGSGGGTGPAGTLEVRIPKGAGGVGFLPLLMMERYQLIEKHAAAAGIGQVRGAALRAGALGTALSGAGPSVLALVRQGDGDAVGDAMVAAWRAGGVAARHRVLDIDRHGLRAEMLEAGA